MLAKNVMTQHFRCLHPKQTIVDAITAFDDATFVGKKKIFGMMVINRQDKLVGMLSMYDILQFIQPKHIEILGEMEDLAFEPVYQNLINRIQKLQVEDIMTTDLVSIKPDTHLIVVVDIMLNRHIRRLPVIEGSRVVGIVYRSDVFHYLMKELTQTREET